MKNWFEGNRSVSTKRRLLASSVPGYGGIKGGHNAVSAMNFHSFGNLWIEPYNYLDDATDKKLQTDHHVLYEAYQEFNA